MKIFDFEKIIFWINGITILVVIVLLAPTTHIVASWYPEAKEILRFLPAAVLIISSLFWLGMRLSLPWLIKWRIFEDRRRTLFRDPVLLTEKFRRLFLPLLTLTFQMACLILMTVCLFAFVKSNSFMALFKNIP